VGVRRGGPQPHAYPRPAAGLPAAIAQVRSCWVGSPWGPRPDTFPPRGAPVLAATSQVRSCTGAFVAGDRSLKRIDVMLLSCLRRLRRYGPVWCVRRWDRSLKRIDVMLLSCLRRLRRYGPVLVRSSLGTAA